MLMALWGKPAGRWRGGGFRGREGVETSGSVSQMIPTMADAGQRRFCRGQL